MKKLKIFVLCELFKRNMNNATKKRILKWQSTSSRRKNAKLSTY